MKKAIFSSIVLLLVGIAVFVFSGSRFGSPTRAANSDPENVSEPKPRKTMQAFRSELELKDYLHALFERQKQTQRETGATDSLAGNSSVAQPSAPKDTETEKSGKGDESITNTQTAGVDEGGIVKLHGQHLVILRRGRLFTVKIGDNSLKRVSSINAYAPGIDPRSDWYDEMLIAGDTVVVIGYSYGRGGTEINLFDIDDEGGLDYRSTYHLRSNDYYSSRNYASRLIGNKLIFYTPEYLYNYGGDPTARFPAVRKWHNGATDKEFQQIVAPTNVFRPPSLAETNGWLAVHTISVCDLANREFSCKGTAVLGSPGRVFYVSQNSVYVWTTDWNYGAGRTKASSMLYRMPLDGSAPSALKVKGTPVDQFSFLESDDNNLNVLVRSDGYGEQMWGSEFAAGDVALFRAPVDSFSDGSETAPSYRYRQMPKPSGYTFQNRFVGDYLLFGTGNGWGRPEGKTADNLFVVNWSNGEINNLHLKHTVDRIEQMGKDAVVVGTNGNDLYFSPIRLGDLPTVKDSFARKNASQGELRSHGFFYKADGEDSGYLGLPIAREGRPGYRHLLENSAAVLFLRNKGLDLDKIGELEARDTSTNDNCRASCVDWYGNARPLFIRQRVFALLGYEIVEGSLSGNGIQEMRRLNYSPHYAKRLATD